jgi:hypothetical protein
MALDHSCQVQRHRLAERGHDLYETPDVAVEALLRVERLPHRIREPAAGRGAIVRVLRRAGHAVITSDVADYGFPLDFVRDFLTETRIPDGTECILTNPPIHRISWERPKPPPPQLGQRGRRSDLKASADCAWLAE